MSTIVFQEEVRIPFSVGDIESFREWTKSDDFPSRGRYSYLNGDLWVDLMPEQLFTHDGVKVEFTRVLHSILKSNRRGRFFGDRTLVNADADLSTEPDGTVVLYQSLVEKRVELVEAAEEGFIEITGSPDVVLEIVSTSSVRKDTVVLRNLYWKAEIPEYWLVDVRKDHLQFDILKHGRNGYSVSRKRSGWMKSTVLDQAFRLTSGTDSVGNPEFTLDWR
jgi:Uma2 family endonuclease